MKLIGCITQQHDIKLVLVAALICATACFTTFNMLSRAEVASRFVRLAWRVGAAIVFGGGVFSTHFISELAYNPRVPVAYEVYTTLLSLVIACCGSVIAILIATSRRSRQWSALGGGLLLGATIGAMHFTGMRAMWLPGSIVFDLSYVVAALLTGGVLSVVGFRAATNLKEINSRISGAFCLLLAICGLHFVAMAAVIIVPGPEQPVGEALWGSGPLAFVVATVSFAILLLSLFGSVLDQHFDRRRAEARIRYLAHHDALTALPNRILFSERIAQALEAAKRTGTGIGVLCIDLDRFKFVNDLLGHDGGDRLLVQAGERLRMNIRGVDTVARLGGDEFAVVHTLGNDERSATTLAQRVVRHFSIPFEVDGQQVECGVSIGIARYPEDGVTGPVLLRNADTALYRAKQDGRSRYCFFEPEMDLRMQQRRALEHDLRHAIQRGEVQLHYQPLFDCTSGELDGFEALLRWNHPVHGSIPPYKFIPLAEESGTISPIGVWVLKAACAEAVSWKEPLRIAVNLSPAQFRQGDLAATVGEILDSSGLAPGRLELEVTEGLLIADSEGALEILRALKVLGVRISLDDFGTGYSSLSYLLRFPFDKLKIDKSFVQALGTDPGATSIVGAILALGQSLNLAITAEGVETTEQLKMLQAQYCDQVQGFLLGRPTTPDLLFTFVNAARSGASATTG